MHFNAKERMASLFLILVIGICSLLYWQTSYNNTKPILANNDSTLTTAWLLMKAKANKTNNNFDDEEDDNNQHFWAPKAVSKYYNKEPKYFNFDPNTASAEDWETLGLKPFVAKSILKYTEKGGRFYKPEDLNKIFLLSKTEIDKLLPFVKIENTNIKTYPKYENKTFANIDKPKWESQPKAPIIVDINYADTTTFRALPGIGSYLANNIVKYRNKLGGFISINQIKEVYGISPETFEALIPQLQITEIPIKKIDINNATLETLLIHPYIKDKNLAKVIISYRQQHGNRFNAIEDLKKIMIVTEEFYNKVVPYIEIK